MELVTRNPPTLQEDQRPRQGRRCPKPPANPGQFQRSALPGTASTTEAGRGPAGALLPSPPLGTGRSCPSYQCGHHFSTSLLVLTLRRLRLFATPWTVARQAPLSMGFSRQQYWSGLPRPPLRDLPNPGIEPRSPALQTDSLPSEPPGKSKNTGVGSLSLLQENFPT